MARAVQVYVAGLALAFATGDGRCSVGTAADQLGERHLALMAVRQSDDHHAEMQQVGDDRKHGGLLSAVLCGRGGESATHLANQRAAHP